MYLFLNKGYDLYLYKKQGLIKSSKESIAISKIIGRVLKYCSNHYTLYDALNACDCDKTEVLIGITKLIVDKKINQCSNKEEIIPYKVFDEENIFYPESLHIELTRKCNLRCYYCYNESSLAVSEDKIQTAVLFQIISELAEKGLSVVEITGGEPLLHPDFFRIVDFCYNHLQLFSILTNGTLVDERFIDKILPYRKKIVFSISLDSFDKQDFENKSRVKGSFDKASKAIKLLSDAGFIVRASMSVDESNWKQIEPTLLYAKSLGATKFTYSPIIPVGRASQCNYKWYGIDASEIADYAKYLIKNYSDYIQLLDDKSLVELAKKGGCGAGSRTFVMNPNGNVRMCATFTREGVIGNLATQTAREVFNNPICQMTSELVLPNKTTCNDCQHLPFCSGCPLRTLMKIKEIGEINCQWVQNAHAHEWYSEMTKKSTAQ